MKCTNSGCKNDAVYHYTNKVNKKCKGTWCEHCAPLWVKDRSVKPMFDTYVVTSVVQ